MTPKEVRALTDEELRIKVARLCGWTDIEPLDDSMCDVCDIGKGWQGRTAITNVHGTTLGYLCVLPDYPRDLNACQEMDSYGSSKRNHYWPIWANNMYRVLFGDGPRENTMLMRTVILANARERCEAFVLTMDG